MGLVGKVYTVLLPATSCLNLLLSEWSTKTLINDYHREVLHVFSLFESTHRVYSSPLQTISPGPLSVSLVFAQILLAHSDIWEEYSIILTFLLFIPLGLIAWPEALCENMENQYIVLWVSPKREMLAPLIQWTTLKPQTEILANPSNCCGFYPATELSCRH